MFQTVAQGCCNPASCLLTSLHCLENSVVDACGKRTGVPAASSMADSPKAVPTQRVCTSGLMYFIVS